MVAAISKSRNHEYDKATKTCKRTKYKEAIPNISHLITRKGIDYDWVCAATNLQTNASIVESCQHHLYIFVLEVELVINGR